MIELWRTVAAAWWAGVAPNAVHVVVLGLAVTALDRALPRRTWPEVRYGLWMLVLARLIVPPGLASPVGFLDRGSAVPSPWLDVAVSRSSDPSAITSWGYAIVVIWLVVALALAALLGLRYQRLVRHWREQSDGMVPGALAAQAAEIGERLGLRRPPRIRMISSAAGPFVVGVWRPTVYLPRDLGPARAEHVLLHELGHLKRGDHWLAALGMALQIVYWFHPLVWYAQRRVAVLREQCCDRTVARVLGGRIDAYRRTLLFFVARRLDLPNTVGLGFFHPRNVLLERLRQLEASVAEPAWLRRLTIAAVLVSLTVFSLPAARAAEDAATVMAEMIERPPGCLTLRYLVHRRLADREATSSVSTLPTHAGPDSLSQPNLSVSPEEERADVPQADAAVPVVPRVRW